MNKIDDTISRQAAIDEIKEIYEWHDNVTKERIIEHFKQLPPAQPEHIKGRWIPVGGALYKCDQCGAVSLERKFCSDCGSEMEGTT